MTEEDLLAFINDELVEDDTVTAETPLFEERYIDSMNILDLIGFIEEHTGAEIQDDDLVMENFRTPRAMTETFLR